MNFLILVEDILLCLKYHIKMK